MNMEKENWYALYTKPRWEKKVADLLSKRKIVNYCPLNKVQKQWSDRKKIVLEPLFRSYVFVRISESRQPEIRQIDGVVNFRSTGWLTLFTGWANLPLSMTMR